MPIIEMHLLAGRSVEKKRKAVAAMTAALVETLEVRPDQVRILITEHNDEQFAVGGQMVGQRNETT
ncbi:MAG: 4-oxalocrotonate tautomerase [Betaproteobacteria bacterium HGW-Betaproteobacteria-4]|jgi:4-oxalocrotonate tautomerase|nr:MAG: 4-oxalocrotonate tautomerase [Betaproteobacteria bacterium HGW-Betaproteobacteria-4]